MFLREIKTKGKIKQRGIAALGCLDKLSSEQLKKIAISLLKYCKDNKTHFDISTAQEKQRKIWGAPAVIRKIWDKFKPDELFSNITNGYKIKFDFFLILFFNGIRPSMSSCK